MAGLVAGATGLAGATVIGGAVVSGQGAFVHLVPPLAGSVPPNTVGEDTFEDPNLYAFDEDQNIRLEAPLAVDQDITGLPGVLAAGSIVASHYVFFDPGWGGAWQVGR
ncbi:MAG: hypothetical protein AAFR52_08480, partial [Pseudomonadota bacterium]